MNKIQVLLQQSADGQLHKRARVVATMDNEELHLEVREGFGADPEVALDAVETRNLKYLLCASDSPPIPIAYLLTEDRVCVRCKLERNHESCKCTEAELTAWLDAFCKEG